MPSAATCGCAPDRDPTAATTATVRLPIVWQRLVSDGETCPVSCAGSTQGAIELASLRTVTEVLRPLRIEPILETIALDQATFDEAPTESNRIWIAGRPLGRLDRGARLRKLVLLRLRARNLPHPPI